MADIFISYARADRKRIPPIVDALEATGRSIWWDSEIHSGAEFSETIERELDAAERVLVLWSQTANKSKWVRDEAGVGARKNTLLCASLDGSEPPLGFRQYHFVDLTAYKKGDLPPALIAALDDPNTPPEPADHAALSRTGPKNRKPLLIGGVAAALAVAGIGAVAFDMPGILTGQQQRDRVTLAVLPFNVPGDDAAGRDVAGEVLDWLGGGSDFDLVSSTSSFAAPDGATSATDIAARLGATHLVEGDWREDGGAIRATLRIVDGATNRPIWNHTIEQLDGNSEELAARSANRIAAALHARLNIGSIKRGDLDEIPPEAIDHFHKGLEELIALDGSDAALDAFNHFGAAIEIAPDWAAPLGAQSMAQIQFGPHRLALDLQTFLEMQEATYTRALELDPQDPYALTARAGSALYWDGDVAAAIEQLTAVVDANPTMFEARWTLAAAYSAGGHYRDALTQIDRAIGSKRYDFWLFNQVRADALVGLNRLDDIANMGINCRVRCNIILGAWYRAILGQKGASADRIEHQITSLDAALVRAGHSQDARDNIEATIRYWNLGAPRPASPYEWPLFPPIFDAEAGDYDTAFANIGWIANRSVPAVLAAVLTRPDHLQLPEEMRRDPRYAALFDDGNMRKVEDYRRARGLTYGLPIREENDE